jgi:hypothetical protein
VRHFRLEGILMERHSVGEDAGFELLESLRSAPFGAA